MTTNPNPQRGHFRQRHTVPDAPVAPPPSAPHVTCRVLDLDAWGDPLQPSEFPMELPSATELEVHAGDATAARFVPADARPAAGAYWLALPNFERVIAEHGFEDNGETADGRWDHEGTMAMLEILVLEDIVRADPVRAEVRGELEVIRRWAEARGRTFGMSAAAIAVVTGRPYAPRRMLLEPMRRARELDAQAREEAERSKRAEAAAATRRHHEELSRTVGRLHLVAVAVRPDRVGPAAEPWPGARLSWVTDAGEGVYSFRAVPGMACPPFDRDGVRSLRPVERVPPEVKLDERDAASVQDPDAMALGFLRERRTERPDLFDMGPMPVSGAVATVPELGHALCAAYAACMVGAIDPRTMWRRDLLIELLVRSELRVRADIAAEAVLAAMNAEYRRRHPAMRVPSGPAVKDPMTGAVISREMEDVSTFEPDALPSRACRAVIARACADAVQRGVYVSAREPLEPGWVHEELKPAKKNKGGR